MDPHQGIDTGIDGTIDELPDEVAFNVGSDGVIIARVHDAEEFREPLRGRRVWQLNVSLPLQGDSENGKGRNAGYSSTKSRYPMRRDCRHQQFSYLGWVPDFPRVL
jgi:hypothetical protein